MSARVKPLRVRAIGPARIVSTTSHRAALLAKGMVAAIVIVGLSALAIGVVMAQTATPASSGSQRATATPVPTQPPTQLPSPSVRLLGAYHLRCWQQGQLVLEEALNQAPAETGVQSLRLQGSPSAGTAVMLLNAGTATCLIKPSSSR